jgi:DNA helicase-2/ATP-dependent DNA helicase PcrA
VRRGAPVPAPWVAASSVDLDAGVLGDPNRTEAAIAELHLAWVGRTPRVIRWDLADEALAGPETHAGPLWDLDAAFLFPKERLRFLCFTNNYDARDGEPRWWWQVKARPTGAEPGGPADVVLPDGTAVWVDGGPRQMLPPLDHPVVHGEAVELGRTARVPAPRAPASDGLAEDQLEAVAHAVGPARIIAPAGSGKTRTLTARLRHVLDAHRVEPESVTAVAYNERAAAELRERLGVDRRLARTIHSLGWEILRQSRPGLELLDEHGVRGLLDGLVTVPKRANTDPIGPYLEALQTTRSRLRDPADVEASRDDIPGFAEAFPALRRRMYDIGRVDHGEQVYGAIEALASDEALRSGWQRRCRHLLVDEFQDLTPAYVLMLRLVASPQLSVFGVGDDDQVIYGYDGADPGFLIDFGRYFPGAAHHALETNYRCPPAIVDAARHLLSYNDRRIDKAIAAAKSEMDDGALEVCEVSGSDMARTCADSVAGWIDGGVAPSDIAVLTRVNSSLVPVKAALVDRGIPTSDLLGPGSLDRTAVRALFAWLRLGAEPERMQRNDLLTAVRRPSRGLNRIAAQLLMRRRTIDLDGLFEMGGELGIKQQSRWQDFCADLRLVATAVARGVSAGAVATVVGRIGLGSSASALDAGRGNAARSAHLDDLVAVERAAALHPDLATFGGWLREAVAAAPVVDGVTLSSVHRVKGMEWRRVVVFGADRGALPHELADDIEEERRVFHVALTRSAERSLVLADSGRPSPFLAELDGSASRGRTARPPAKGASQDLLRMPNVGDRVRVWGGDEGEVVGVTGAEILLRLDGGAEVRFGPSDVVRIVARAAGGGGDADPSLVATLKQWRLDTSRERNVPAYVVFSDATLEQIAIHRPLDETALLRIQGIGPSKLESYGDDILAIVAGADAPATR